MLVKARDRKNLERIWSEIDQIDHRYDSEKESLCRAYYSGFSEYFGKEYTPCIPETIVMSIGGSVVNISKSFL